MEKSLLTSLEKAVKNWWISLLVGIIAVVLGIWCIFTPLQTFLALTIIFIVSFFIEGILEISFAISNKGIIRNWGWTLAMGIVDFVFAILLIINLQEAPIIIAYLIAFWILFQSFWGFGMALELQQYKGIGSGWILALSVLGILFAIMLLFQPAVAAIFAAYLIGFSFIFYGIARIYIAYKLKSLHKYNDEDK